MGRKKIVLFTVLVLLSLLATQCAPAAPVEEAPEAKVWKLAAIFPGVITDADYNTLAYEGIVGLQKQLASKLLTPRVLQCRMLIVSCANISMLALISSGPMVVNL